MKKHDETKDLRLVGRMCKIDYSSNSIRASKDTIIGNKTWGRIDYLTHYCGWRFVWDASAKPRKVMTDGDKQTSRKRNAKQKAKDNSLSNKSKRR